MTYELASAASFLGTVWWSILMVVVGFVAAKTGIVGWAFSKIPWNKKDESK
jgi:hypothetical protein|tara:strand:- start:618 stop:770 length:153 start_codon:yes stop_codon:yes gene_type:complete